jgi:hypothetical protein
VSLRSAGRELLAMDRTDLALRLVLVALLFAPVGDRWMRPLFVALAGFALLAPSALRSAVLWLALAGLAALRVALDWPMPDNHAYLLAYWCLAAAIASAASDRGAALAWNGRALVALTFLFATLWKAVLSPDFLDGRFFGVTLLDDRRMEDFARLAGGLGEDAFWDLRELVREHSDGVFVPWEVMPEQPPRFRTLAQALTFGTLAIEGALAALFLLPLPGRLRFARHALLLVFCAGTYALAPVAGFGWLLLSMGVAQTEPAWRRLRLAYLGLFVFVLFVTRWPWLRLLAEEASSP